MQSYYEFLNAARATSHISVEQAKEEYREYLYQYAIITITAGVMSPYASKDLESNLDINDLVNAAELATKVIISKFELSYPK